MAIQGPLRELGIHDVFQLLDLGKKTGALQITSALRQNEGMIWFHEAAVVAASIQSNPTPLGTILLRSGKVREEDLTRARALQEHGDRRRIGEILVAIGAVTEAQMARILVKEYCSDLAGASASAGTDCVCVMLISLGMAAVPHIALSADVSRADTPRG